MKVGLVPGAARGGSVVQPELSVFAGLLSKGFFVAKLPAGVNGTAWLEAPVTVIKGITTADATLLARYGVTSVRSLALSASIWDDNVPPALAKKARAAQDELVTIGNEYNVTYLTGPEVRLEPLASNGKPNKR